MSELQQPRGLSLNPAEFYVDRRGRVRSNNPDDLWSAGIRNIIMSVGFLTVAMTLLITSVAGGEKWWWAMLIPAFTLLANGIGSISKSKRLEKNKSETIEQRTQLQFSPPQPNASLPPSQTEYVEPQKTIYDTGELVVPPSVTEGTTRHLEINKEGETMTLPKKQI